MLKLNVFRAGIVVVALAALPLTAVAQDNQQSGTAQQGSSATQSQGQQQPQQQGQTADQNQGQGFGQGQGQAADARQQALSHLTLARQALADMTKLPAASHLEGQTRNDINQLITNFNTLITSSGPEWRQAYDKVQDNLRALLGPENAGQPGDGAVGTSGTAAASIDASLRSKLSEVRDQVNQFGQVVGVKPGESASAQAPSAAQPSSQPSTSSSGMTGSSASGTPGTAAVSNEQALRSVDQINAILSRVLAQPSMSPNQDSVTVSRQDLQQIQQYLNQLRQSLGGVGR